MATPQQPEIGRSGRGAVNPDAIKSELTAPQPGGAERDAGPVPEDNLPGHHPEHEQDKPSGDDFVAKVKDLAAEAGAEKAQQAQALADEPEPTVAGDAMRAAAGAVRKVREHLPGGEPTS